MTPRWLVWLAALTGCAQDVESSTAQPVGGSGCPPWECQNSPETLLFGIHDLHLFKEKNAQGMSLEQVDGRAGVFANGLKWQLIMDGNRIQAVGNGTKLAGSDLIGAELHVIRDGLPLYNIYIARAREIRFPEGEPELLEVYSMGWYDPNGKLVGTKNVCNDMVMEPEDGDLLGMWKDELLVFTGDKLDSERLELEPDPSEQWLNFGCAARTLAKLHLTRNTTSSDREGEPRGHQATLKLLAGDYCGTGWPITVSGTPLRWQGGKITFPSTPGKLEARWDEHGAQCVSSLRLDYTPNPAFPDPWGSLWQQCAPPQCKDPDPYELGEGLRVSALPNP